MSFLDIAKSRYTTKNYDPDRRLSAQQIEELREVIRLSPSSINSQPWKFFFVADDKTKRALADASYWNAQRINEASHLVVFTAIDDIELFEQQIQENLPEGSVNYYNRFVKPQGETAIKSWLRHQVYLSLGFFLSACACMGIDSTPMEGIQNEAYDKILQLNGYKTLFAVAIGCRNPEDFNQPTLNPKSRLPLEHVVQTI